jgi:choline kinase
MLAAGIGIRLGFTATKPPPKVLLRIGGKSLLQFHIEILKRHGIDELVLGVGYHQRDIERQIAALGAQDYVRTVFNADFEEGNIVTLWALRDELRCDCWSVSSTHDTGTACSSIVLSSRAMSLSKSVSGMARLSSSANG